MNRSKGTPSQEKIGENVPSERRVTPTSSKRTSSSTMASPTIVWQNEIMNKEELVTLQKGPVGT